MGLFYVNSAQNIGRKTLDTIDELDVAADGSIASEELLEFLGREAQRLESIGDLIVGKTYIRNSYQKFFNVEKRQANRELKEQDFILQRRGIHFTCTTSLDAHRHMHLEQARASRRQAGLETDNLIRLTAVDSGQL